MMPFLKRYTNGFICALVATMLLLSFTNNGIAQADENSENIVDPTQRADNSFIYDTTIDSLHEQGTLYDDRTVQITGEVIGDRIASDTDGFYWITLTSLDADNPSSITALMSSDQTKQIDKYGKYGITGTQLQVRGTFNQACREHNGLADIHVTHSDVRAKGVTHFEKFSFGRLIPGIITIAFGLVLVLIFQIVRERMR